jgi:hypothetical protein
MVPLRETLAVTVLPVPALASAKAEDETEHVTLSVPTIPASEQVEAMFAFPSYVLLAAAVMLGVSDLVPTTNVWDTGDAAA